MSAATAAGIAVVFVWLGMVLAISFLEAPLKFRAPGVTLAQLALVRPRLSRRTDAVLAGRDAPRSFGHHAYVVLELAKAAALLTAGIMLLRSR